MKQLLKKILHFFGFDIVKIERPGGVVDPYCRYSRVKSDIVDVDKLGGLSLAIPGMITSQAGKFLYALCYMQSAEGDVVEIGSWQGRSSLFLAQAVKESGNGKFYAIDHFGGNAGKESFYKVDGSLDNLKDNFLNNMVKFGLDESVTLLDMENTQAAERLKGRTIRFLFIDGDHTREGVEKDITLFFPMLTKGSIVVFDDYFEGFPGVIEAVDALFEKHIFERIFYHRHTLVLQL